MIYIFKAKLMHAKRIWRRIEIGAESTFHDLHETIYDAFDRDDEHLYSFYLNDCRGGRGRRRNCPEITHPMNFGDPLGIGDLMGQTEEMKFNAAETRIGDIKLQEGDKIEYLFDFGDNWSHEIVLERVVDGDAKSPPKISDSRGESPEQYPQYDEDM